MNAWPVARGFRSRGKAAPNSSAATTPTAGRILADFDALGPREKLLARAHVVAVTQGNRRDAIARPRGSAKGERPLEPVPADRAEGRARG